MGLLNFGKGILRSTGLMDPETPDNTEAMNYLNNLPQYEVVDQLNPEEYIAGPSSYETLSVDPTTRSAQMSALSSLQKLGEEGGMTLADKANLAQIAQDEMARARGTQEAIAQNAASRGISGSGLEMAQRLIADQGTAQRQSQRDLDVAAQAQARALQAIQDAGNLGGKIHSQDYQEAQNLANARDAIAAFNLKNRQAIDTSNLANQQRIAESNVSGKRDVAYKKAGFSAQDAANQAAAANAAAKAAGNTFGNVVSWGVGMPGTDADKESKKTPWSW